MAPAAGNASVGHETDPEVACLVERLHASAGRGNVCGQSLHRQQATSVLDPSVSDNRTGAPENRVLGWPIPPKPTYCNAWNSPEDRANDSECSCHGPDPDSANESFSDVDDKTNRKTRELGRMG